MHWLTLDWWRYLLAPRADRYTPWLTVIHCRATGHPCGYVFYNVGGSEPDYTCKNCGDDL